MAHGDYECCACCDERGHYDDDAAAKDWLCASCACELARRGVYVHNADEFLEWVKTAEVARMCQVLIELGFRQCYYGNKIDRTVTARLESPEFGSRSQRSTRPGTVVETNERTPPKE